MSSTDIKMRGNYVNVKRSNENEGYYIIIFDSGHGVRNKIIINENTFDDLEEKMKRVKNVKKDE